MEKVLEDNEHNVCFFLCITAMREKKKAKPRKGRRMRTMKKKNVVTIIVAFFSGLCLIDLNMKFVI